MYLVYFYIVPVTQSLIAILWQLVNGNVAYLTSKT